MFTFISHFVALILKVDESSTSSRLYNREVPMQHIQHICVSEIFKALIQSLKSILTIFVNGENVGISSHARNPSLSPFFFASRINPCRCFESAPIDLQNSVMT